MCSPVRSIPQGAETLARRLAAGVVAAVLLVLGMYAWAWASLDRSSIARARWWREADVATSTGSRPGRSRPADTSADPAEEYQYFWWIDTERPGFYALGNFGQYIYVAPDSDTVIVRNGRDWGVGNDTWLTVFRDVADQLADRS